MLKSSFHSTVLILTVLVIFSSLVLFLLVWPISQAQAQGCGLRYKVWSVIIQGESNGKAFQREGRIMATQSSN